MFCLKCRAEAGESQMFCGSCGASLTSAVPESEEAKTKRRQPWLLWGVGIFLVVVLCLLGISGFQSGTPPLAPVVETQKAHTNPRASLETNDSARDFDADPLIGEPVDKYQPCAEAIGPLLVPGQFDYASLPSDELQTFFLFSKSGINAYALRIGKPSPSAFYLWRVLLVFQDDWARREQLAKYLDFLSAPDVPLKPGAWYGPDGANSDDPPDLQAVADFKYAIFSMDWVAEENPGQPSIAQVHMYAPLACYSWTKPGQAPTSEIGMIAFPPPLPSVTPDSVLYRAAIGMNKVASQGK